MKGKNFTAAEKHFMKKQGQYESEIKRLKKTIVSLNSSLEEANKEKEKLFIENVQIKEWIDRLLSYTELSQDDIRNACEKDKEMAGIMKMFNNLMGFAGGNSLFRY